MPLPPTPIEITGLSKTFGRGHGVQAVSDLTFRVAPGRITGFLGPNGAGKTTTLRCLVGLVRPTAGSATIAGQRYDQLHRPSSVVGAALEASGFHPARTGRDHLRTRTAALGLPASRADELLDFVGLSETRDRKAGAYSLGMRQRLALAMALVGDPPVLVLDEPANGLDPAGIAWLRQFLRALAAEGRTILVSSHLLAEVRQTVDDVVIIDRGRLLKAGSLDSVVGASTSVHVRGPDLAALADAVRTTGAGVHEAAAGLTVVGLPADQVGHLAWQTGTELHELRTEQALLEQVFLQLTAPEHPMAAGGMTGVEGSANRGQGAP